jgi:presenilin-like A22 family membrane protease
MATASASLWDRFTPRFTLDWYALFVIAATVVVQVVAVTFAMAAISVATPATPVPEQSTNASTGGTMVGAIIVETVVLVLLWRLRHYLPEWLRTLAKYAIGGALLLGAYWLGFQLYGPVGIVLATVGGCTALAASKLNLYWLFHNTMALTLGIAAAIGLGIQFAPRVVLVFLALLTVWDMVAVWGSDWMDGVLELATNLNLPVYLVIPAAARIDLSEVAEWVSDKEDEVRPAGVAGAIGLGDLGVPAALAVSAAVALPGGATSPAVIGTLLGACLAVLPLRGAMRDGSTLPALPWLATGTVAGFVLGVGVAGVSLLTVLGGGL